MSILAKNGGGLSLELPSVRTHVVRDNKFPASKKKYAQIYKWKIICTCTYLKWWSKYSIFPCGLWKKYIFRLCRFCLFIVDRNYDPFVCLFDCLEFYVQLENFSFIWRRHHYGEGLQILTYTRHSLPLSSEGSLACHTYRDTGHPFIMVISEDPWQSQRLPWVLQWSCNYMYLFQRLMSVVVGIQNSTFRMRGERFNWLRHRSGIAICTSCLNIETMNFYLQYF